MNWIDYKLNRDEKEEALAEQSIEGTITLVSGTRISGLITSGHKSNVDACLHGALGSIDYLTVRVTNAQGTNTVQIVNMANVSHIFYTSKGE